MQSVVQDNRLQDVRTRLLKQINVTKKRINPIQANTFNAFFLITSKNTKVSYVLSCSNHLETVIYKILI